MTQIEVAARSGIAQSRLSRYENGRKHPDLFTLDRLLSCYGVDLEGLGRAFKETQKPPESAANDPELVPRVRDALVQLGYSKPSLPPES